MLKIDQPVPQVGKYLHTTQAAWLTKTHVTPNMHFCKTIYRYILHLPAQKLLQGGLTLISGLASQLVGYIMIDHDRSTEI